MKRYAASLLGLGLALLVPVTASAQKDNKYTKEASKFIGLAMAKTDAAAKQPLYEQALAQLQQGIASKDSLNAKLYLLAGQAYVGLNRFQEADAAFDKAVAIHPPYAEEIASEREQGWIQAFNAGAELMNQGKLPEAITALELAQQMYAERPEGLMNLGALYSNQGDLDKAATAFIDARKAITGPLAEKLDSVGKAQWARFDDMARINLSQLDGQRGVNAFQTKDFATAAAAFRKAKELNPYSRDFVFNLSQAIWAQASAIEEKIDSLPEAQRAAAKKQAAPELISLYQALDSVAGEVVGIDPTNELVFVIMARSHRMIGEYSGDQAKLDAAQAETVKLLEAREKLPVELSEIMITNSEGVATVRGTIKNRLLTPGSTTTIKFTLFGIDGRVLGEQAISMTAPEKDQTGPFEGKLPVAGEVAGWKYALN
ncbi:MAG: tetratricopeptide repeat protein [Gemmatimonadetes bacterium]|nr:tetratricopeptide repeat protein [Gemmatimonadota bacterium]